MYGEDSFHLRQHGEEDTRGLFKRNVGGSLYKERFEWDGFVSFMSG